MDQRIVNYIKTNLVKGYKKDLIRNALLSSGYSTKDYYDALAVVERKTIQFSFINFFRSLRKFSIQDYRNQILVGYTYLSLMLGFFSMEYIALNLSKTVILDYILLGIISDIIAVLSYVFITKISPGYHYYGYIVTIGVIFDLFINNRVPNPFIGVLIILFFFTITYFLIDSFRE